MIAVSIRELKQKLSRYLRVVRSGETIIVTDRKREVAAIVPWGIETDDEKLLRLIQQGLAYWTGGKPMGLKSRIVSGGKSVSDAVVEDRR